MVRDGVERVMDVRRMPRRDELEFTERFSETELEAWRTRGDPEADACVAKLVQLHGRLGNIFDLLNVVKEQRGQVPEFEAFLQRAWSVPEWMDFAKIERGRRLIAVYAPFMGLSLFAGSLVGGSMFQKAAVVTSLSGQLSGSGSTRRVEETAFLIGKMVLPGGLQPGGESHETLVRVRLLHAALRHHLVSSGKFDHPVEVPINQQDLAITLGLFGYLNLRSLHHLNISLTEADMASFMLMWRYAGHLLGIEDALLPHNLRDQQEFFMASLKHQCKPEAINPATKDILNGVAQKAHEDTWIVPESTARRYLHQMCRYLSGNEYCSGMQIEDEGDWYWGLALTRALGGVTSFIDHYVPFGESLLYNVNMLHMQRFFNKKELQKAGFRAKL